MNEASTRPDWLQELTLRIKSQWWLKAIGTTVSITLFLVLYFVLIEHPQFPVTDVPWTPIDHMIGIHWWAIVPYASLWFYISLVPAMLWLRRELAPYFSTVCLLSVIGLAIFFFWPTTIASPGIDWHAYPAMAFLKVVAPAANACPSMHVAFSVLTVLWLHRLLRRISAPAPLRWLNVFWSLFIIWSTMALKQHLLLDVVAGAALALVIVVPHLYFLPESRLRRRQLRMGQLS